MKGIPKGLCSFGRVQRQRLWWGSGQSLTNPSPLSTKLTSPHFMGSHPDYVRRSAKGELKNSPVDCFSRGNALQERAFLNEIEYWTKKTAIKDSSLWLFTHTVYLCINALRPDMGSLFFTPQTIASISSG